MNDIRALVYADTRAIVNAIRDIRRNRGRLILWTTFVAFVAVWLVLRAHLPVRTTSVDFETIARCDLFACLAIGLFGFFLARGSQLVGLFSNPAEGRWIIAFGVQPFGAAIYLQVRGLIRGGTRVLISLGFAAVVYLPAEISPAALWRDLLFAVLALLAIGAVPLPRRLAHGFVAAACSVVGYAGLAVAAVPLARNAAIAFHLPYLSAVLPRVLPAWHPGTALIEPPNAHSAAVAALLVVIAAGALLALGLAARDALPELYAFSIARIERIGSGRRIGLRFGTRKLPAVATGRRPASGGVRVPSGVAIFIWKAWTEYRRRTLARVTAFETAGFLIAGFVVARLIGSARPEVWIEISTVAAMLVILSSISAGLSVAAEIRRPLFWLSDAPLFERLSALVVGHVWRFAGWFLLVAAGLATGRAGPFPVLSAAVLGPVLLLLCGAIGTASFALFPNELDQRGPLAMLRLLVSYAFLLPAIVTGVLAGTLLHSAVVAFLIVVIVVLAETATLVAVAAWRLDTRVPS